MTLALLLSSARTKTLSIRCGNQRVTKRTGRDRTGSPLPSKLRASTPAPGFQELGVKPRLGPNPEASSERADAAHLIVISSAQHLAGLRVHQMRLGAHKARSLSSGSSARTGARRGVPLLGRFLRPGHWLSHTGAPVRWQGGRKARMDETPTQPISFRRRCRRSPKEIQCIRDATLVRSQCQRLSRSGALRGGVTKISSPAPHFKKTVEPCQR